METVETGGTRGTGGTGETVETGGTSTVDGTSGIGETVDSGVTGEIGVTEVMGVSLGVSFSTIESGMDIPFSAVFKSSEGNESAGIPSEERMYEYSGSGAGAWAKENRRTRGTAGRIGGSSADAPKITSSSENPL